MNYYSCLIDTSYARFGDIKGFEIAVDCDTALELGELLSGFDVDFIMDVMATGEGKRFYWVSPTTKEKEIFVQNLVRAYGLKRIDYPEFVRLWDLATGGLHEAE